MNLSIPILVKQSLLTVNLFGVGRGSHGGTGQSLSFQDIVEDCQNKLLQLDKASLLMYSRIGKTPTLITEHSPVQSVINGRLNGAKSHRTLFETRKGKPGPR